MSKANVIAFNRKMHEDPELQGRIQSMTSINGALQLIELIELARFSGLSFTLQELQENYDEQLLSDELVMQMAAG